MRESIGWGWEEPQPPPTPENSNLLKTRSKLPEIGLGPPPPPLIRAFMNVFEYILQGMFFLKKNECSIHRRMDV